jgi:hypothetical protein
VGMHRGFDRFPLLFVIVLDAVVTVVGVNFDRRDIHRLIVDRA